MLAGLEAEHGHGRVPVVGRGDGDGVDFFRFEGVAEIAFGLGRVAEHLLRLGGEFGEDAGIDVADIGDAGGLAVGVQRGEMRVAAAVEAVDGKVQPVVGAENLRIAFCRGCKRRACDTGGQAIHKCAPGNHLRLQFVSFSLSLPRQIISLPR